MSSTEYSPESYNVGWVCVDENAVAAAASFLDDEYNDKPSVSKHDSNNYILGRINRHRVVIASLPKGERGTDPAATVARNMLHTFPNVRIGLLVGIGGGVPSPENDIRLGDVVVSSPGDSHGGVFQFDLGIAEQDKEFEATSHLNNPPQVLRTAVTGLQAEHIRKGNGIEEAVKKIIAENKRLAKVFKKPDPSLDKLFKEQDVPREGAETASTHEPANQPVRNGDREPPRKKETQSVLVKRLARDEDDDNPDIHYGLIASSNKLVRDANLRDRLAAKNKIICFETEAAGLMNHFPCLVIRGICDYADSHADDAWRGYATMTAAAYAKALLQRIPTNKVEELSRIQVASLR